MRRGQAARLMAMLACSAATAPAIAQSDVVVMRRVIAPANLSQAASHQAGTWTIGEWAFDNDAATCTDGAAQSRTVVCVNASGPTVDANCHDPKPDAARTIGRYDGCTIDWVTSPYGDWTPSCGENASRTRSVECLRSGGDARPTTLGDDACPAPRPDTTQTGETLAGCTYQPTYDYGACAANSAGSNDGAQPSSLTRCLRSDGADVTTANESSGYADCAAHGPVRTCTLGYEPVYSTSYAACVPASPGASTGTATAQIQSCTAHGSDGSSYGVPNASCPSQTTSRPCTLIYTASYTYGSCSNGYKDGTINRCLMSGSDGSSSVVDNSYCGAATVHTACTMSCDLPVAYHWAGNGTGGAQSAVQANGFPTAVDAQSWCNQQAKAYNIPGVCLWASSSGTKTAIFQTNTAVGSSYDTNYASACYVH